jgi:HD superfamily phosphohydrolase
MPRVFYAQASTTSIVNPEANSTSFEHALP